MLDSLLPWKTLSTTTVIDIHPWFSVLRDEIVLPSGRVIDDYYRISAPDYVIICPFLDDNTILMERHYKQCLGGFVLTSPAGGIDPGETPLQAAQRELLEETGYSAQKWTAMGAFTVDGTRGICKAHLFSAHDLKKISEPTVNEAEEFAIVPLDRAEIILNIQNGRIQLLPDIALLSMIFGPLLPN